MFVGWNKNFDEIKEDLEVNAIFMKNTLDNIVSYTSYVSSFSYNEASSYESLLENFDYYNNLKGTIPEIVYGGFRETNKIHYYDKTNIRDRNRFGFEVAIDENNVVIEKAVLVNLPTNGAILSGHGEGATTLGDLIKVGDVIIYEANKVDYFRQKGVSEVFDLYFKINRIKELILSSYEDLKALNYQLMLEKTNQLINLYNGLISSYSETEYQAALALYMDVSFLSIEETSSMVKAYWHYPTRCIGYMENNVASIASLLDEVARMGLNRIYLNTNYGGYAVYKSSILTQKLTTYYNYVGYKDYLECFISLAHARGIEVYAWTNTLIAGDGEPNPYYSVRNWLNIFYDGSNNYSGMHYIDIANVDARAHLLDVFDELAGYDLDGIEFDFIRYANSNILNYTGVITNDSNLSDSGYTESFIQPFMDENGLTGDFKSLIRNNETIRVAWYNYKRELLTDLVKDLSSIIKEKNADIKISAAVMPSITTARKVFNQDWKTWIEEDYIDVLEPMIYTGNIDYLTETLSAMKTEVADEALIVVGIYPEGSSLESSENAYQIARIMDYYVFGFSKFSSRNIFINKSLRDSLSLINKHYTTVSLDPLDIKRSYAYDLYDKINNFYQYVDTETDYEEFLVSVLATIEDEDYEVVDFYITLFIDTIKNPNVKAKLQSYDLYIKSLS
ncbi:MAG: glycoside hydrolase family 10 protein [Bacilli bacterium]